MFCPASQSVISASSSGRTGALVAWAEVNKAPESDEKCGLRRPRIRRRKFRIRLAGSYNQQCLQQNRKPECDGSHKRVWFRHTNLAQYRQMKQNDLANQNPTGFRNQDVGAAARAAGGCGAAGEALDEP
jgi:hypothetical protein